jgi:hypothetical protein
MGKADNPGKGVFLQEFMQDLPREMTVATVPIPAYVIYRGFCINDLHLFGARRCLYPFWHEKVKLNAVILRPPSARVEMTAS